jgi:hypothetical protein
MSNRILSLFILVLIFSWAYFFYYYFFVLNKWNLTLTWNVTNYEVNLYNEKLKTTFKSTCKNEVCELVDIAPFDYKMTIIKKWYKDYSSNVKIEKKSTFKINFALEKDLIIEKVEDETWTWSDLNVKDKIEELRKQKDLADKYAIFDLWKNWNFYFKDNKNNTLSLFKEWEKDEIYSFSKVSKDLLNLEFIENSRNMIFIKANKNCFIINLITWDVKDFEFHPKVNYVKKDSNVVSIVTEVWTYLYNMDDEKVEYFNFFKDFLYYGNDSYLWVIYSDDKERKANYNLLKYNWNLIVKYNYKTKEIKVLKETELNITKIIWEAWNIYFYDDAGGKYLVSNVEE